MNGFLDHGFVVVVGLVFACVVVEEEGRYFLQKYGVIAVSEERKRNEQVFLFVQNFPKNDENHNTHQHIDEAQSIQTVQLFLIGISFQVIG